MANIKPIRNNFNAGELSPKLDFRGDVDKYHSGCELLQNMIPLVEGGASRVPGTYFVKEVKTSAKATRALRFQFSTDQAYELEFGDQYIRFYRDGANITLGGLPVEISTPYLEADIFGLKVTQSADVLYIFHESYAPRKLVRTSHTVWNLYVVNFKPPPTREFGHQPDTTLTPSATTGSSVTFTAGAAAFLTGDIGRIISSGVSRATITIYLSSTVVICDILDDFSSTSAITSGDWTIEGSPSGELVPSRRDRSALCTLTSNSIFGQPHFTDMLHPPAVGYIEVIDLVFPYWQASATSGEYYFTPDNPAGLSFTTSPASMYVNGVEYTQGVVGALNEEEWGFGDNDSLTVNTVYLRLPNNAHPKDAASVQRYDGDGTELFRTEDVGKFVVINFGIVEITGVKSSIIAVGEVLIDLETTAAGIWSLEEPIWSDSRGYPSVGYFFEQRLVVGGSPSFPNTMNMSVSGDYENFTRDAISDDAAIEYSIVSDEVERIRWFSGSDYLIIGTFSGLWTAGAETAKEPVKATRHDGIGVADIAPINATDSVIWADKSKRNLYKLEYKLETEKFVALNITRFASHLFFGSSATNSGIVEMAFQKTPIPVVWAVRTDGVLVGLTYNPQENISAGFRVVTDGAFESVSVIDGGSSAEDQVWMVVKRIINGSTVRYIEYFTPMEIFSTIADAFFMHSGVSFDGGGAVTITNIEQSNPAVVHAVNTYSGGEEVRIEDVQGMTQANTGVYKAWTVANPTAGTFELSGITSEIWDAYTSGGTAQVVKKDFTTGLDHLEFKTLDILVDGSPHAQKSVSGGALSLNWYGNKVHMGLPTVAQLKPTQPYIGTNDGGSTRGKKQRIYEVLISYFDTYGIKIGPDTDNLKEIAFGNGEAPSLETGEKVEPFPGEWGRSSPFVIYQDGPLPLNVRAIVYNMDVE